MGKGTARRTPRRTLSRASQKVSPAPAASRTRSFPCPDDLWEEIQTFANERGLGSPAAATRLLLRSGLGLERRARELEAARDWQIEQAWTDLQAIAGGDRTFGSWDEIERAAERARLRAREREATARQVAARA